MRQWPKPEARISKKVVEQVAMERIPWALPPKITKEVAMRSPKNPHDMVEVWAEGSFAKGQLEDGHLKRVWENVMVTDGIPHCQWPLHSMYSVVKDNLLYYIHHRLFKKHWYFQCPNAVMHLAHHNTLSCDIWCMNVRIFIRQFWNHAGSSWAVLTL
ncbi:hypothetical protein SRHO_G00059410 [Serrasalmus rhombeus]